MQCPSSPALRASIYAHNLHSYSPYPSAPLLNMRASMYTRTHKGSHRTSTSSAPCSTSTYAHTHIPTHAQKYAPISYMQDLRLCSYLHLYTSVCVCVLQGESHQSDGAIKDLPSTFSISQQGEGCSPSGVPHLPVSFSCALHMVPWVCRVVYIWSLAAALPAAWSISPTTSLVQLGRFGCK